MIRRTLALFGAAAVALLLLTPAASAQYVDDDTAEDPASVQDAGADPGTTLPRTGSDSTGNLWRVAVVLVAAGGLLVLIARSRAAKVTVDA
jgi:LPXTG-motif cell wall-anchored protein